MKRIRRALAIEPVRLYSIAVAAIPLIAYYVEDFPSELWLVFAGAVLLGGDRVRNRVTPTTPIRRRRPLHARPPATGEPGPYADTQGAARGEHRAGA